MLVKFFENNKGGGVGSVYYLLNDRVQEGTAKLLRGDKELTLALINSIEFKHKVTFGSLNFTEKNLTDSSTIQTAIQSLGDTAARIEANNDREQEKRQQQQSQNVYEQPKAEVEEYHNTRRMRM